MRAAIDDIHHRHRQRARGGAADIAVERQTARDRRGLRDRKRNAQQRIGAKPRLVGRTVERNHGLVDADLFLRIHAADSVENLTLHCVDRLAHALAQIAGLITVAQFYGLMRAGRGARRHRGAAKRAIFQKHVDLDGRIAAAVENFSADDIDDGGHGEIPAGWDDWRRFYRSWTQTRKSR